MILGPEPLACLHKHPKLINLLLAYHFASHIIPSALRHTTPGDNDKQGSWGAAVHGVTKNQTGRSNRKTRHKESDPQEVQTPGE